MRLAPASRIAIATFQLFFCASASAAAIAFFAPSRVMYFVVPSIVVSLYGLQIKSPIWYSDCMELEIGPIRHVGLFTPSLEEHARFYAGVWGLDQIRETNDAIFLRGSSPEQFILSLHRHHSRGLHHIAYAMADESAVRRASTLLKEAGVRIVQEPHRVDEPGGGFGLRFIDPDGRCIELSAGAVPHSNGWRSKNVEPSS